MTLLAAVPRSPGRRYLSQAAGFAVVIIAATVLLAFWTGRLELASWGLGSPQMRPAGALVFAVVGFALVRPGKDSRIAFGIGVAIVALAFLGLVGLLFDFDFALDHWLVPRADVPRASFQAVTAGTVAAALVGGSLALGRFERYHFAATVLAGIVGSLSMFVLLGYLTGIDTLYGSVSVNSPPLPTAIGMLCIAAGIVSRIGTIPPPRRRRPLSHLLVMLGCAIVVPLLLFAVYAGARIADGQLRQVRENLTIEARALSASVDREIIGEIGRLQALAASPSLRLGDFAGFQRQAEASLAMRQSGIIVLIDRNMQQLVNTLVPFGTPLQKAALPEPVERTFATGRPQITDLFIGPATHRPAFAISVPVQIDGENRYALVRSPSHLALAKLVGANMLPAGWQAVISDAAHRIVTRSERQDAFIGQELPPMQHHRNRQAGVFEFVDAGSQPSLEAYVVSPLTGWETAVWASKALLEGPVGVQWRTLGVIAVMAFTLVIALFSWLGGIIARSVGEAAGAASALGEGNLIAPRASPVAEVDTLMKELGRTAARRQAADNLLRESEATFRAMFDISSVGKFEIEPGTGRFLRANAAMCEFVRYGRTELLAKSIFDITHPEDRDNMRESCRRLDDGTSAVFDVEERYVRKDGNVVWARTTVNAIRDEFGRPLRNTAVVLDFTEHKEREEKEHLLMREINHRAKNMLSVVHCIAQQTAARNPDGFVESFSERIQALSANQDLLVRNQWNGVVIEDLVRAQLAPFADLMGSRVAAHGPRLRLTPASAQAVGLALHELSTNAGKYGALSTATGRVDISWGVDADTFTMSWVEREGPSVSAPTGRGFGTIVMKAMAERSVGGAVDLDYAPSGLTWRLACPAGNALEPPERERNSQEGQEGGAAGGSTCSHPFTAVVEM